VERRLIDDFPLEDWAGLVFSLHDAKRRPYGFLPQLRSRTT
jgi:hypothetical protein